MLIVDRRHVHCVLEEFFEQLHTGRSHHGAGLALRAPDDDPNVVRFPTPAERIQRRTVLAGLTGEYRQAA
jgi:hypothetical protein